MTKKIENKYYTPSLEEFRVGFEYCVQQMEELYGEVTYVDDYAEFTVETGELDETIRNVDGGRIRVKYLDSFDLESLGFKLITGSNNINQYQKHELNRDFFIYVYVDNTYFVNKVTILFLPYMRSKRVLFDGKVKNISELKVILIQIGINYDK